MLFNEKIVMYIGKLVTLATADGADHGVVDEIGEDFLIFSPEDKSPQVLVRLDALIGICLKA